MARQLSTTNHDRDVAGLKYIYPVISRRAGGLSIGVNFNPNNACNWRCIYCQVPDLQRGTAPEMDFGQLADELRLFLDDVLHGDFFQRFNIVPEQRVIKDIAISGNGEPTSLKQFAKAVQTIGDIANAAGVFPHSRFVLISNGSLLHQSDVQAGLQLLANYGGELWFKLDSATQEGRKLINNNAQSQRQLLENLSIASRLCPTKLQTCMLHYQQAWSLEEKQAYLQLLQDTQQRGVALQGVMLYSLAREPHQPEAADLQAASAEEMATFAAEIRALGFTVSAS